MYVFRSHALLMPAESQREYEIIFF
jgi:hypothetical protein